jgi:hypothetical protein
MIDALDMMIIVEEKIVVTVTAILKGLTANGTEKVKTTMTGLAGQIANGTEKVRMTMTGLAGLIAGGIEKVQMTMTVPAGAEVETSQSHLVALRPRNDRLLSNPPLAHALALGLSPLRLMTRQNPTSLIPDCWLQRQMLSS